MGCQRLVVAVVLTDPLREAQVSSECISQNPSQKGNGSCVEPPRWLRRATGSADLAWLLRGVSPKPKSHASERDVEEATEGEG